MSSPIPRIIRPVGKEQQVAFDQLFDSIQDRRPTTLIEYDLSYPKSDFLNYLCDWREFVMHGSPLHDLDTLHPSAKATI